MYFILGRSMKGFFLDRSTNHGEGWVLAQRRVSSANGAHGTLSSDCSNYCLSHFPKASELEQHTNTHVDMPNVNRILELLE